MESTSTWLKFYLCPSTKKLNKTRMSLYLINPPALISFLTQSKKHAREINWWPWIAPCCQCVWLSVSLGVYTVMSRCPLPFPLLSRSQFSSVLWPWKGQSCTEDGWRVLKKRNRPLEGSLDSRAQTRSPLPVCGCTLDTSETWVCRTCFPPLHPSLINTLQTNSDHDPQREVILLLHLPVYWNPNAECASDSLF